PVVALLVGIEDVVAAAQHADRGLARASVPGVAEARGAAVAGDRVAVVALFGRADGAVAAPGRGAVRVAPVAAHEVAVVALLVAEPLAVAADRMTHRRRPDRAGARPAGLDRARRRAAVAGGEAAVVAAFAELLHAVAADRAIRVQRRAGARVVDASRVE